MGQQNSSITRVWPVFLRLISQDRTGTSWLPRIFERVAEKSGNQVATLLAGFRSHLQPELVESPPSRRSLNGQEDLSIPYCFEYRLPPPEAFLRWLLQNAGVKWAVDRDSIPRDYASIEERRRLFDGSQDEVTRARTNALAELSRIGVEKSFRKWWAFEGYTSVDCFFETNDLVLLIEGKRTDVLSPATKWYPERSQLARNLEIAQCQANGKQYGVLLITENEFEVDRDEVAKGWPHLKLQQRSDLWTHYLGSLTWPMVCSATQLPQSVLEPNVDEAMTHLRQQGLI